jgi:hypothetical protein
MPFYQMPCFQDIDPTLPVVVAAPGYFRIAIDPFDPLRKEPFNATLDPVLAWRIDYYAIPITADELSDLANYAILRPDGRVTYPFNGEFKSLDNLVAKVNQEWDELRSDPSRTAAARQSAISGDADAELQGSNRSHVTDPPNKLMAQP